ncbi:MAG: hypothetical protein COA53_02100 [Rhodobacteraceae bacterium]|nr:MAG: hypothetical protein COA53_02100 [Paracoccaceae bacterium]
MSGRISLIALVTVSAVTLAACTARTTDRDYGMDSALLENRDAGIWVDGNGCDHWIIDDGFEGYMSPRLTDEGKPVCREGAVPYSTIDFERTLLGF